MSLDSRIRDHATTMDPDRGLDLDPEVDPEVAPQQAGRILLLTWLVLMALTVGSYALSDIGRASSAGATPWLLAFAVLKSHLIAGIYMEMRHGPRIWLALMSSFLIAEAALVCVVLP